MTKAYPAKVREVGADMTAKTPRYWLALLALTSLILGSGCGAASPPPHKVPVADSAATALLGSWQLIAFEGRTVTQRMAAVRWTFASQGAVTMSSPDATFRGSFSLGNPERRPRRMALMLAEEPTEAQAIFAIKGDELLLKVNDSRSPGYPSHFSPETGFDLMKFRRAASDTGHH